MARKVGDKKLAEIAREQGLCRAVYHGIEAFNPETKRLVIEAEQTLMELADHLGLTKNDEPQGVGKR